MAQVTNENIILDSHEVGMDVFLLRNLLCYIYCKQSHEVIAWSVAIYHVKVHTYACEDLTARGSGGAEWGMQCIQSGDSILDHVHFAVN